MKILFWQINNICKNGTEHAFRSMSIDLVTHKCNPKSWAHDQNCLELLSNYLNNDTFTRVFTVNFVPIISKVCEIYKIPYLSRIVDSPCFPLYSKTISKFSESHFSIRLHPIFKISLKKSSRIFLSSIVFRCHCFGSVQTY